MVAPARQPGITIHTAGSAADLSREMNQLAPRADVVVMAAAVADYRVAGVSETKVTKESTNGVPPTWQLAENEDILAGLVERRRPEQTIVGFAAETPTDEADLLERGRRKRRRKGCDLLAVNAVGWDRGFEAPDNELIVIGADDRIHARVAGTKQEAAAGLVEAITEYRRTE